MRASRRRVTARESWGQMTAGVAGLRASGAKPCAVARPCYSVGGVWGKGGEGPSFPVTIRPDGKTGCCRTPWIVLRSTEDSVPLVLQRIHKIIRIINICSSYHRMFCFCRPPDYARIRQSTHTPTIADTSTICPLQKYNAFSLKYSFFMRHAPVLSRRKGQDDDGQGPQDEDWADRAGQ